MSLATRCTSCGTIFRVVQDQLKVSEGWVRCGRCDAVFNALEGLFDLERDDPPPYPAGGAAAQAAGPAEAPIRPSGTTSPEPERDSLGDYVHEATLPMPLDELPRPATTEPGVAAATGWAAGVAAATAGWRPSAPSWVVASHEEEPRFKGAFDTTAQDDSRFEDARFPADAVGDETSPQGAGPLEAAPERAQGGDEPAPSFVRQADRRAFWSRTPVRAVLSLLALLLLAAGAGQVAYQWHDEIAARWPPLRPVLAEGCARLGCTIAAPRDIGQVVVESTALTRTGLPDAYRLTVVLRNRAAHALARPSIDLSLTDVSGVVVSRRALAPEEFAQAPGELASRAESTYELLFAVGNRRVTGYTVAVFYP
jgi:predicted Zn finger-like uncharacterized protein